MNASIRSVQDSIARYGVLLVALIVESGACVEGESSFEPYPFIRCSVPPIDGQLQIVGKDFAFNGLPVQVHGVNSYPLLQHAGEGRWDAVRDIFGQAVQLGRPYVRTNAFMDGSDHPGRIRNKDGSLREEGLELLDRVIVEAQEADVRLLLVLTNNWSDYGGVEAILRTVAPEERLPKDAFWSDSQALEAQRQYERALASRTNTISGRVYGKDPTIFAWELANEPRCVDLHYCDDETLVRWAREMARALRDANVSQPIAWGGAGYDNRYGEDLPRIAADGEVDILTLHLYPGDGSGPEAAVREGTRDIERAQSVAEAFDLPVLVEELGYHVTSSASDEPTRDRERAEVFNGLLGAAHALGLGVFPWMIGEVGREDYDGLLIRPTNETTFDTLRCE